MKKLKRLDGEKKWRKPRRTVKDVMEEKKYLKKIAKGFINQEIEGYKKFYEEVPKAGFQKIRNKYKKLKKRITE
jgi:hypothetical protein